MERGQLGKVVMSPFYASYEDGHSTRPPVGGGVRVCILLMQHLLYILCRTYPLWLVTHTLAVWRLACVIHVSYAANAAKF